MKINDRALERFQRVWAQYDKEATGFIKVGQLRDVLYDLGAQGDKGAALVPFHEDCEVSSLFFDRQIKALEIPTYENQRKVLFYDVLLRLVDQTTKMHIQEERLLKIQVHLEVLQKFGAVDLVHVDKLASLYYRNPYRKERFDFELMQLIDKKLKEKKPTAELIKDLREKNKVLR